MENFEGKLNNSELSLAEKLDNFQNEIAEIKGEEMKKKEEWETRGRTGEAYNPHFDIIDPDFLSEAELGIYEKFKSGELAHKEFETLREEALSRFEGGDVENDPGYKSIHAFWMYLGNIVNAQSLRKQLDELKGKK